MENKKITKYALSFGWQNGWKIKCDEYEIIKETKATIIYKSWYDKRIFKSDLDVFKNSGYGEFGMVLITFGDTTREQFVEMSKEFIEKQVSKYKECYEDILNAQKELLDELDEGSYNE